MAESLLKYEILFTNGFKFYLHHFYWQTCRNNLLEKRQRKFDSELQAAQEELKRERSAKERLSRERDQAHAEKYAIEQSLSVSMKFNSSVTVVKLSEHALICG